MVQESLKMPAILYIVLGFLCCFGNVNCYIMPKSSNIVIKYARDYKYIEPKQEIFIPVMVHIDTALAHEIAKTRGYNTTKAGKRRLNFTPKLILRDAEKILRSLNQKVYLKLVNFKVLHNQTFEVDENISEYLRNYCLWQKSMKVKKNRPYFSVLLTGLDVYYVAKNGKKVRESTGRGYMGRMCTLNKSCAVVKWHQTDLVYLLAHEIAHSLGVYHDGTKNNCRSGFIMAAQYSREHIPQQWSTCSKVHLEEFLRNKEKSWCVNMKLKKAKFH